MFRDAASVAAWLSPKREGRKTPTELQTRKTMIVVQDDMMLDPLEVRAHALAQTFYDWEGPDGQTYKRVWIGEVPGLREAIEEQMGPCHFLGMGYRLNYAGEMPNQSIHSDLGWGTHAAVVYLSAGDSGTAFWRHLPTGSTEYHPDEYVAILSDVDNIEAWEMRMMVSQRPNRGLIYESALFHSRFPFEGFGSTPEDGRLIAVAFFTPIDSGLAQE